MTTNKPAYLISAISFEPENTSLMEYAQAAKPIFDDYGAQPLVIGTSLQQIEVLEGLWLDDQSKLSVVKFPSMQQLKACLSSSDYLRIKPLRDIAIKPHFSIAID